MNNKKNCTYKQYHIPRYQGLGQDMDLILEPIVQFTTYISYFVLLTIKCENIINY